MSAGAGAVVVRPPVKAAQLRAACLVLSSRLVRHDFHLYEYVLHSSSRNVIMRPLSSSRPMGGRAYKYRARTRAGQQRAYLNRSTWGVDT